MRFPKYWLGHPIVFGLSESPAQYLARCRETLARIEAANLEARVMATSDMDLETIEEATIETEVTEATESTASIAIQALQSQLEEELKRHNNTVKYYQQRVKDEKDRHSKAQQELEAKLLQAIAQAGSSVVDGDYWLNNTVIPEETTKARKPTRKEKTLIRAKVKQDYLKAKKK